MSVIKCKYCDSQIDTDFNAEHEEECGENFFRNSIAQYASDMANVCLQWDKSHKEITEETERLTDEMVNMWFNNKEKQYD